MLSGLCFLVNTTWHLGVGVSVCMHGKLSHRVLDQKDPDLLPGTYRPYGTALGWACMSAGGVDEVVGVESDG